MCTLLDVADSSCREVQILSVDVVGYVLTVCFLLLVCQKLCRQINVQLQYNEDCSTLATLTHCLLDKLLSFENFHCDKYNIF